MMSWWLILGWGIIEEIMWYCKPSHKSECTQPLVSPKATQRTKFQHLGVYKTNEPGPRIGSQNRWNMCEQIGISPSEMGVINLQNICMGNNWGFAEDSIRILIDSPCFGLFQCANWYQPVPTFLKSSFNVSRGPWSISTQTWQWKHRTSTFHNDVPECWDIPLPQWLFFQRVSRCVMWHHVDVARGMTWRQGQCDLGEEYSFGSRVAGLGLWESEMCTSTSHDIGAVGPLGLGFSRHIFMSRIGQPSDVLWLSDVGDFEFSSSFSSHPHENCNFMQFLGNSHGLTVWDKALVEFTISASARTSEMPFNRQLAQWQAAKWVQSLESAKRIAR